ncbi:MAG: hypothetical protein K2W82_11225 [Candidatus Obscuribacterales bacterium]|jgi:hypothetical protein|nr:hypothetical protein [Candidatus Obscuribacterales bacterium]
MRGFSALLLLAFLICSTLGCSEGKSLSKPQSISDYSYSNQVGKKGEWTVFFDSNVSVQTDEDGIVTVNCHNNSRSNPCLKVSGKGVTFRVYNATGVIADEGVILEAYNCSNVKARNQSKIKAFTCIDVYAQPDAELISVEGCSKVWQEKKAEAAPSPK